MTRELLLWQCSSDGLSTYGFWGTWLGGSTSFHSLGYCRRVLAEKSHPGDRVEYRYSREIMSAMAYPALDGGLTLRNIWAGMKTANWLMSRVG
jgi:hypothetical protein